jgi:dihydroorotate dehydrogenase
MIDQPLDLAPRNPYGLALARPLLPAPGCAVRDLDMSPYGAFVTRTATLHTRHDAVPRFAAVPGGLVVSHLPTVGLRTLLKEEGKRWERSTLPVIVSLQGDADELGEMAARFETYDIAGLLLLPEGDSIAAVRTVRSVTPRPILAMLRYEEPPVATAKAMAVAGVDAVVLTEPPRAAAPANDVWDGFLLGPAVFPLVLQHLRDLAEAVPLPRVVLGGITTPDAAHAAFGVGADAIMIDAVRWGDLTAGTRIAESLDTSAMPRPS